MHAKAIVFVCLTISEVFTRCVPTSSEFADFEEKANRGWVHPVKVTVIRCPELRRLHYLWESQESGNGTILKTETSPSITIDGYELQRPKVAKSNGNEYELSVCVSHYVDMTPHLKKSRTFTFASDQMYLELVGEFEKTHKNRTLLIIDAQTLTKDTNFSSKENEFKNKDVRWSVYPLIGGLMLNTLFLRVPPPSIKFGTRYNFFIRVTRTKAPIYSKKQTVFQIVRIASQTQLDLNVSCSRNCVNPRHGNPTIYQVLCVSNCEDLNYEWTVTPKLNVNNLELSDKSDTHVIRPSDQVTVNITNDIQKAKVSKRQTSKVFSLMPTENIKNGTCQIDPKNGYSGSTKFKVSCHGFSSSHEDLLYMIFQNSDKVSNGILLNENKLPESDIYLSEGNPAIVRIQIRDLTFVETELSFHVVVKPFTPETRNTSAIDAIKDLILKEDFHASVPFLASIKSKNRLVQTISFLLDALDRVKEIDESLKKALHWCMAEAMRQVPSEDFPSAVQIVSILTKLEGFREPTDTRTANTISSTLKNVALSLHQIIKNNKTDVPYSMLYKFGESVFQLEETLIREVKDLHKVLEKKRKTDDNDYFDEVIGEKFLIRSDMEEIVANMFISTAITATDIIKDNLVNQKAIDYKSNARFFTTRRVQPKSLSGQNITTTNSTNSFISLPEKFITFLNNNYAYVDYQFSDFQKNPFWWHKKHADFKTDFVSFDLFYKWEKIKTTEYFIHSTLKTKSFAVGVLKGEFNDSQPFQVHKIQLQEGEKLLVTFEGSKESFKVVDSYCYCTEEDFSRSLEIKPGAHADEQMIQVEAQKGKRDVYICFAANGASSLSYIGNYAAFSCVYWTPKNRYWVSDGCQVKNAKLVNGSYMVCECKHASLFAGLIRAPANVYILNPNIDFQIVFIQNWVALLPSIILPLLWFILVLWARYVDKKLNKRNVICVLDDNIPGDKNVYLMVIFTGYFLDASTTADVGFQVIGSQSDSRVHLIKSAGHKLLQRNGQDWIVFYTPHALGRIKMLRLWHNSKGRNPHWYCSRIIIKHMTTGYEIFFIVNNWFSLVWGDGKTYRKIKPPNRNELKSVKMVFPIKFEMFMKNNSMWVSVWARDPQSNFSSVERVSCCVAFLSLIIMVELLLNGIPHYTPTDSIDINPSEFFNYKFLVNILIAYSISFPVIFVISLVFRFSRPRERKSKTNVLEWDSV